MGALESFLQNPGIYNEDEKENIKMTHAEETGRKLFRWGYFGFFTESTAYEEQKRKEADEKQKRKEADEKQKRKEATEVYGSLISYFTQRGYSLLIEENDLTDMPVEAILMLNKQMKCKITKLLLDAVVTMFRHLVLLAILFHTAAKVKELTSPGRNRICCVKVFLLSNEGAHAYNGNGTSFTKHEREERVRLINQDELELVIKKNRIVIQSGTINCCNRSQHDEQKAKHVDASTQCDVNESIDNSNLSVDTLQRKPSDKEICTIALNIGQKWCPLALQLGLSETELYHIKEDNRGDCVNRNIGILFRWRRNRENSATFEELRNACIRAKVNPGDIFKNIEEA